MLVKTAILDGVRFDYKSDYFRSYNQAVDNIEQYELYTIAFFGLAAMHEHSFFSADQILSVLSNNAATKREKLFVRFASKLIISYDKSSRTNINRYLERCAILNYLINKPLNCLLTICIISAIELFIYNQSYVDWLPEQEEFLFYAIPIGSFFIIWLILLILLKDNTYAWKISFIIAFFISLFSSILCYSWAEAVESRTHYLIEELGPDYEDILEEYEFDSNFTNM